MRCVLKLQGFPSCDNVIQYLEGYARPCEVGIKVVGGEIYRLIYDIVLSRPEDYLSIYQSLCNHKCLKCHSWYFSQIADGRWMSPADILTEAVKYRELVTVWEPLHRATMWHASDLCAHCGACLRGSKGPFCPDKLRSDQIIASPQGFGPARNIISFTGGDLYCNPAYYIKTFKLLKKEVPELWIHIETNGYGLTPKNLDALRASGLDSIWLDMKAYDEETYRKLCGTTNKWILEIPALAKDLGIVIEIVLLYIPGFVELDQIEKFGELLSNVDTSIPITLLAFFPEFMLRGLRAPTVDEMLKAFAILKSYKLKNIKVGNVRVFCKDYRCIEFLIKKLGRNAVSL
ncbi:MAG: radical SAM protein [Thermoprotei archaeon]|nr:MAG: radical SAM protein [Thermoprotei archaeon]